MTDDEIIAVVQAHKEGKKVEVMWKGGPQRWIQFDNPRWNFEHADYRVAPEPRKPRVLDLVYEGGGIWKELCAISIGVIGKSVRFREVIEDRECNCGFPDQHHSLEHYAYCNSLK